MKALTLQSPGTVMYTDVDDPALVDDHDAIIRIAASALCGSDLHVYQGRIGPVRPGVPIGHEFVGIVEATGPAVGKFRRGDRVTGSFFSACGHCWACVRQHYSQCPERALFGFGPRLGDLAGTQAQFVRVPHADVTLIAVPETLSDAAALTVGDILSTAYFAVDRAGVRPGDTVAVVGLGPVGLLVVEMSYIFGAARVVGLDVVRERLDAAERLGAVSVVANRDAPQAVRALTDGRGADAVVEAVGQPESLALALRLARGFAIISSAGVYTDAALPLSMPLLFERDLTLRAGMCNVPQVALHAMALVESGRIQPENLFSHELPLSDGPRAYRLFAERLTLKVLLRPWTSV